MSSVCQGMWEEMFTDVSSKKGPNESTHSHSHTNTHTEDDIILPQGEASNLNRSDTDVKPMSPFIARSHSCQQWLPSGRVRTACTLGSQGSKSWSYQATYSVRTLRCVNSEQISLVQTLTKEGEGRVKVSLMSTWIRT